MSMFHGHKIPEVSAVDAETSSAENILLDVRETDEWEAGHAAHAQWIPLGELESARFKLPMNRRIVCVCRSGARSAQRDGEPDRMGIRGFEHGGRHEGVGRLGTAGRT